MIKEPDSYIDPPSVRDVPQLEMPICSACGEQSQSCVLDAFANIVCTFCDAERSPAVRRD